MARDDDAARASNVRVMLPLDCVSRCASRVRDDAAMRRALDALRACGCGGVMIDCWWGLVEGAAPRRYEWRGYSALADACAERGLKIDFVLSFHACGGSVGDGDCEIELPAWTRGESARENMYADARGGVTEDYLSLWGDETRDVRRGDRSPLECYRDFMASFRVAFEHYLCARPGEEEPVITQVTVGLGPCGELRYPSYRVDSGWYFPGVGEFQAYDERARMSLAYEAAAFGKPEWGQHPPTDSPGYNRDPEGNLLPPPRTLISSEDEPEAKRQHTIAQSASNSSLTSSGFPHVPESTSHKFFATDGSGSWDKPHGKFFLAWYHRELIAHGERVLEHAVRQFEGVDAVLGIKCAGLHWWHKHPSRAAECVAGYYNANPSAVEDGQQRMFGCEPCGYTSVVDLCAKFNVELTFTCVEMRDVEHDEEYLCSPESLLAQIMRTCAERGVRVNGENALARFDDEAYAQILSVYARYGPQTLRPPTLTSECELVSKPNQEAPEDDFTRRSASSDDTTMNSNQSCSRSSNRTGRTMLGSFTYLRACDELFEPENFLRFSNFIQKMATL